MDQTRVKAFEKLFKIQSIELFNRFADHLQNATKNRTNRTILMCFTYYKLLTNSYTK